MEGTEPISSAESSKTKSTFLTIPAEIRRMIYEELSTTSFKELADAGLIAYDHIRVRLAHGRRTMRDLDPCSRETFFAMAQVNRQTRAEAAAYLYRHLRIHMWSDPEYDEGARKSWLQHVHPAVFASITRFDLHLSTGNCWAIRFDLNNLGRPVKFALRGPDLDIRIASSQALQQAVQKVVQALPVPGGNGAQRKVMTREAIETMISLMLVTEKEVIGEEWPDTDKDTE